MMIAWYYCYYLSASVILYYKFKFEEDRCYSRNVCAREKLRDVWKGNVYVYT